MKSLVESVSESLRPSDYAYKQINDICSKLVKKDSDCWDPRDWIQEMILDWGKQYLDELDIEEKIRTIDREVDDMDNNTIDEIKALIKHKKEYSQLLVALDDWHHPIAKYIIALLKGVEYKYK